LVEHERRGNTQVHDGQTLGTDGEWQDLDGVRDEQRGVGDGVRAVEREDLRDIGSVPRERDVDKGTTYEEDKRVTGALGAWCNGLVGVFAPCCGVAVHGSGDGDERVGQGHACGRDEPERATTEALRQQRGRDGDGDVPDLQETVKESLLPGLNQADVVEDDVQVVCIEFS